jgi:CubicO group peptidase (beta-lactamase class C family)
MRIFLALMALCWATGLCAQDSPRSLAELDRRIAALVEQAPLPGASIAVVEGGEIVLARGYGLANTATGATVSPDTRFKGGSVSKNVTALLALVLAQRGVIDLNERLDDILPDAAPRNPWADKHPIRLIHLLEHTAGLEGSSYHEYASSVPGYAPTDYARAMAPKLRVRWEPGYFFSYSNPGYALLAAAIEKRTGKDFDTLMREVLFQPLGMTATTFLRSAVDPNRLARSYDPAGRTVQPHWDMTIRPSGGIITTPRDLAQLVKLYLARGTLNGIALLPADAIARMEVSQTSAAARAGLGPGTYGSGNFGFLDAGHLFQGHWGSTEGFRTHLGYSVAANGGYVIMTNADDGTSHAIRDLVARYLTRDLPPPVPYRSPGESRNAAAAPEGWYLPFTEDMAMRAWIMNLVGSVHVSKNRDGSLTLTGIVPFGPARLVMPSGGDTYREAGIPIPTIAFARDAASGIVLVDGEAKRPASWWTTVLPFALLIGALVVGGVLAIYGIIAGAFRLFRQPAPQKDQPFRAGLVLAGACFALLFAIFIWRGLLGDWQAVTDMGSVSLTSLSLLGLSVIGPVALLVALWQSRRLAGEARLFRGFAAVSLTFLSAGWLILGANGWVPFVSFAH